MVLIEKIGYLTHFPVAEAVSSTQKSFSSKSSGSFLELDHRQLLPVFVMRDAYFQIATIWVMDVDRRGFWRRAIIDIVGPGAAQALMRSEFIEPKLMCLESTEHFPARQGHHDFP